jgi:predicted metal-binding membrane protein
VAGIRNGGWCLGCCWALMAALFALGVMSLTWMVVIAALLVLEKTSPWPAAARSATAIVLVALAVGIFAAPHRVPGLVVPGHGAMAGMSMSSR